MTRQIILASASPHRRMMLEAAGIPVETVSSQIDERAVEHSLGKEARGGEILASILAEAKALEVSKRHPDAIVIGCDQTLSLEEEILHKPTDMTDARQNLLRLSGKTHRLNSGIVLAEKGEALWRHVAVASMTMRNFDAAYTGRYLAAAGDKVLGSVGVYQVEGIGINLFDKIDGDFFTIVGLPLLPLLAELRNRGLIDG